MELNANHPGIDFFRNALDTIQPQHTRQQLSFQQENDQHIIQVVSHPSPIIRNRTVEAFKRSLEITYGRSMSSFAFSSATYDAASGNVSYAQREGLTAHIITQTFQKVDEINHNIEEITDSAAVINQLLVGTHIGQHVNIENQVHLNINNIILQARQVATIGFNITNNALNQTMHAPDNEGRQFHSNRADQAAATLEVLSNNVREIVAHSHTHYYPDHLPEQHELETQREIMREAVIFIGNLSHQTRALANAARDIANPPPPPPLDSDDSTASLSSHN